MWSSVRLNESLGTVSGAWWAAQVGRPNWKQEGRLELATRSGTLVLLTLENLHNHVFGQSDGVGWTPRLAFRSATVVVGRWRRRRISIPDLGSPLSS